MKKRYKKRVFDNLKTSLWFFFSEVVGVIYFLLLIRVHFYTLYKKKLKICVFFSCVLFWKESSLTPRSFFFVCVFGYLGKVSEDDDCLKKQHRKEEAIYTQKKTISRNTSSIWYGTYSIKNLFKEIENETKIWW